MDEKDEKDSTIWMTAMCGRKEGCNQPVHQPQVSPPTFILVIIIASPMLVVLIAKSQLRDRGRCSGVKNCNAQFIVNLSTASNGQRCHINERGGLGKPSCKKTDVFSCPASSAPSLYGNWSTSSHSSSSSNDGMTSE